MQRLSTVALALLALVVAVAAGYVVAHNDDPPTGAAPLRTVAASSSSTTPTPSASSSASASATASGRRLTVAFIGDDWTRGERASRQGKRYTSLVAAALGLRERTVAVDGTGYATTPDYAAQVDDVVAARPDLVVVTGGRNDVVAARLGRTPIGEAGQAARALFATLHRRLPEARLVAVRPMWGDSVAPSQLDTLAGSVDKAVTAVGGTYLDLTDPIQGHPDYMADDADPDDRGYAAIATALAPQLRPLLAS